MKLRNLVLCFALMACGPSTQQIQTSAANGMAIAVNAASSDMLERYEAEGNEAIEAATTADQARASLSRIKAKWDPVWLALDSFRLAHDVWAKAIQSGDSPGIGDLLDVYCVLASIPEAHLPKGICND